MAKYDNLSLMVCATPSLPMNQWWNNGNRYSLFFFMGIRKYGKSVAKCGSSEPLREREKEPQKLEYRSTKKRRADFPLPPSATSIFHEHLFSSLLYAKPACHLISPPICDNCDNDDNSIPSPIAKIWSRNKDIYELHNDNIVKSNRNKIETSI